GESAVAERAGLACSPAIHPTQGEPGAVVVAAAHYACHPGECPGPSDTFDLHGRRTPIIASCVERAVPKVAVVAIPPAIHPARDEPGAVVVAAADQACHPGECPGPSDTVDDDGGGASGKAAVAEGAARSCSPAVDPTR